MTSQLKIACEDDRYKGNRIYRCSTKRNVITKEQSYSNAEVTSIRYLLNEFLFSTFLIQYIANLQS